MVAGCTWPVSGRRSNRAHGSCRPKLTQKGLACEALPKKVTGAARRRTPGAALPWHRSGSLPPGQSSCPEATGTSTVNLLHVLVEPDHHLDSSAATTTMLAM